MRQFEYLYNRCAAGDCHFISASQGESIIGAAIKWLGDPYWSGGDDQNGQLGVSGADCSHSTCSIYGQAGFPYGYQTSGAFAAFAAKLGTPFDLVTSGPPQVGDILLFPGHMAIEGENGIIYTTHGTSTNYSSPNDVYGTDNPKYFGPYKDYRYELPGPGN